MLKCEHLDVIVSEILLLSKLPFSVLQCQNIFVYILMVWIRIKTFSPVVVNLGLGLISSCTAAGKVRFLGYFSVLHKNNMLGIKAYVVIPH